MFRLGALISLQEEESREQRIVRRCLRDASNPLELPDTLFIQHYRLNKAAFKYVLEVLDHNLPPAKNSFGISPIIKLCSCLRFFAEGGYQKGVARDYEVGLAQSTFCEVLSQVLDVLEQKLCGKWITYPTNDESSQTAQGFYRKFGIPGVVGCIDGTHINIVGPKENKHLYYNRKGTYSLNATLFESDSANLEMLERARTSTPVPLNYHKNSSNLTMNISNESGNNTRKVPINGGTRIVGSRKRKTNLQSNLNHSEDAPSPSKLHQKQQMQHSNGIHSRQSNYSNSINNIKNNQHPEDNENVAVDDENNDDGDIDGGADYTTSYSHLQTTFVNSNNNNKNIIPNKHNKTSNNNNPIDEYGVFGEYVAITIRKLKTSKAKIVVKHLINNLLYEAEMGKYDQGISSLKEPPELYKM